MIRELEQRGTEIGRRRLARACQYTVQADQVVHGGFPFPVQQTSEILLPIPCAARLLGLQHVAQLRQATADRQFLSRAAQPKVDEFPVFAQSDEAISLI